jgi:hypothetical protein
MAGFGDVAVIVVELAACVTVRDTLFETLA